MHFSSNIRYLRSIKGLTQGDLAKDMDITPSTVTGWENGRSSPTFQVLIRLREYFDVDLESLVFLDLQKEFSEKGRIKQYGNVDTSYTHIEFKALVEDLARRVQVLERKIGS